MIPRLPLACALALTVAGCGGSTEGEQLPPPAAAMASGSDALTLEQKLESLDTRLGRVLDGGLDESGRSALYAIEAVTDRLLEEEPAVIWLGTGYDVEARLRQIQALADRVIAEMRRDVASEYVLQDIAALRFSVRDLRTRMQQPGAGRAPPPLDSLLARVAEPDSRGGGAPSSSSDDEDEEDEAEVEGEEVRAEDPLAPPDPILGFPLQ